MDPAGNDMRREGAAPGGLDLASVGPLVDQLRRWDGQRRLALALIWGPRGLAGGLLVAAVVATLSRMRPLLMPDQLTTVAVMLALMGAAIALAAVVLPSRTLLQRAQYADGRFGLLERASTAVELLGGRLQTTPDLAQRQLVDTVEHVMRVPAERQIRPRIRPAEIAAVLGLALLLAAAIGLPNPHNSTLERSKALAEAIETQVEELRGLADEIRTDPDLSDEQKAALLQPLESALAELQARNLSQEMAVAVLSEAAAEFRDLAGEMGNEALRSRLASAGRALADFEAAQPLARALQDGDLAAAATAVNALDDALAELNERELTSLAQALQESAAGLEQIDTELAEALQAAAESLAAADSNGARQALREAAGTLRERALEQTAGQWAERAARRVETGREAMAQAGQLPGTAGEAAAGVQGGTAGLAEGEAQAGGVTGGDEAGLGPGGPGPGGGHSQEVYVPEVVDLSGETGIGVELPSICRANPELCGALLSETDAPFEDRQSRVPYEQVFGQYRDIAYQALDQGYVPLGLRELVRDYFALLEP
jgi:hypothetical protein